jgi:hypothetical protein
MHEGTSNWGYWLTKRRNEAARATFKNNGNGTETLSGTPAAGTAGNYPITITASNGVGTAATQSFNVIVNSGPDFSIVANPASITISKPGPPGSTSLMLSGDEWLDRFV